MYCGDGGNRTHVRKYDTENHYVCSLSLDFTSSARQTGLLSAEPEKFSSVSHRLEDRLTRLYRRSTKISAGKDFRERAAILSG